MKEVTGRRSKTVISVAFRASAISTAICQLESPGLSSSAGIALWESVVEVVLSVLLRIAYYKKRDVVNSGRFANRYLRLQPLACVFAGLLLSFSYARSADPPQYSVLIDAKIERLQADLDKTRDLVEKGILPRSQLAEAQERLEDARDEGILARTLYGSVPMERFTEQQATDMIEAARRRVERRASQLEERRKLLEGGAISRGELDAFQEDLDNRRQVLTLAQNRNKLLGEMKRMAETENRLQFNPLAKAMIRYNGNGAFSLADLPAISAQFERRFHRALPVSALGQTSLHQSLGLDHRNRVDVALAPGSPVGLWLRGLLEKLRVPYLGFNSAVAGAATAPHLHIGPESTRLSHR